MPNIKVKLCGFKEKETIDFASQFNIDFMGFIFYEKSPRNVDLKKISEITKNIPKNIKKVAVIVDATNAQISKIIEELNPEFLQLHGDESARRVGEIKDLFQLPIIKAFRVEAKEDLEQIKEFEEVANYFLFDAKVAGQKGGSGKNFDWSILKNLNTKKDWFLSGGINANNLEEALKITGAKMIDLSSALEKERGVKSKELIEQFMKKLTKTS